MTAKKTQVIFVNVQSDIDKNLKDFISKPGFSILVCSPEETLNFDFFSDVCHCGDIKSDHGYSEHTFTPMVDSYLRHINVVIIIENKDVNNNHIVDECKSFNIDVFIG